MLQRYPQSEEEYKHVVENHRLPNGLLFGLPVVFDTSREDIKPGQVCTSLLCPHICSAKYPTAQHGTARHGTSTD